MLDNIKERIEKLRLQKRHFDLEYWQNQSTSEEDSIYDQIKKEFGILLEEHPEYKLPEDDMIESAYMQSNGLLEVHHKKKMMGLAKSLNIKDYIEWQFKTITSCLQYGAKDVIMAVFECKIDGMATSLEYDNGLLLRASTRKEGVIGLDITPIVMQINDIPKKLNSNFTGEIGGEIYMKHSSLNSINEELNKQGKKLLKNVRNAASGIVRQKDQLSSDNGKYLNFLCYRCEPENINNVNYTDDINLAKSLGFKTVYNDLSGKVKDIKHITDKEIEEIFKSFEEMRKTLDLDIDGVVIKINDKTLQQNLGEKSNTPNWAEAYKFPPMEKITILEDVTWEVGNKGQITPMAVITPVDIGGTTVKRPTLHNLDEIKRLDLKIGDTIVVSRRGDVIPKVERVLYELRPSDAKNIIIPDECPVCHHKTTIDGAYLRCDNSNCRIFGKTIVFKDSLKIKDFGDKVIDKLISSNKIQKITDIFNLKLEDISILDRMGDKSAKKIIDNISKAKKQPLWRITAGLSIPNVSDATAKTLVNKFKTLDNIKNTNMNDLLAIKDIGSTTAANIIEWFKDKDNLSIIDELTNLNMDATEEKIELVSNKLQGQKIAFTGKLEKFTRSECEKVIIANGGEVFGIKKEMNILLVGSGAKQHKIDKAIELGAKVINEEEFLEMIK